MKKLFVLIVSVLMSVSAFAQNAKSTGLTDSDVRNFAKNYNALNAEMERTFGDSENPSYVTSKVEYAKAEKILAKYGFSGSNTVEKFAMMTRCIGLVNIEKSGALEMYKSMGMNPFASQMQYINQVDYEVVERNWNAIAKAIDFEGIYEEAENESAADRKRLEEEEAEYQAGINEMMSSIMGMMGSGNFAPNKTDSKALKSTFDSEVKLFKEYLNKFDASSKKDIGFIYKKYDKANASKYKLESKNSMAKYMTSETGYTFCSYSPKFEGTQAEVYFQMNTVGTAVYYTMDKDDASDYVESTKAKVDTWDIYTCGRGREIVYYLTDGRIVHVWMDGTDICKAVLETDSIKLEGVYTYSPF